MVRAMIAGLGGTKVLMHQELPLVVAVLTQERELRHQRELVGVGAQKRVPVIALNSRTDL
jgi:hypothetical protein